MNINNNIEQKYTFDLTFREFFEGLILDQNLREHIINIFKNFQHNYAFWEFPPVDKITMLAVAEFVLVPTTHFGNADSSSFKEHLKKNLDGQIVVFPNLSGDTLLITVNSFPNTKNKSFSDILSFMKSKEVDNNYKHNLLIKIGEEIIKNIQNDKKLFLSTHGHGVPWLHIRLCTKAKYYSYRPYAEM